MSVAIGPPIANLARRERPTRGGANECDALANPR